MWFVFAIAYVFLQSLVNYIDEYLTANNKVPERSNIHAKIGGLLLISTLLSCIGAGAIWIAVSSVTLAGLPLALALLSAIPMVAMFAAYFYLLTAYPVYQVMPLFLLSTIWLLAIELLFGGSITAIGLLGVTALLAGAYFLDAGTFKWQIPTKLLLISIPATSAWAIALYMVRVATEQSSAITVSFWQLVGITFIGICLFLLVRQYREGFLFRIKHQGKNFLGFSLVNESLAQGSFVFANLAVAVAPVAAYVAAMGGVQSIFVLLLFILFPLRKDRAKVTRLEIASILLIAIGVFMIEM